jgi:formimidoylglutamase
VADLLEGLTPAPDPRDPRASSLLQAFDDATASSSAGGEAAGLEGRLALLGLPYDGGIPSRPGARLGPSALRAALGGFATCDGERELDMIRDLGDLALPSMNGAHAHARIEEAARRVFDSRAIPVFVGGDHGCTGSVIRGLAAARPELRLALITVDAHLDVREYADEARLSSGTPFRRALETGVLEGGRTAMIGIRRFANSGIYLDWARDRGIRLYEVDDLAAEGAGTIAAQALAAVAADADAVYLSIDLDAADAAVAPGVSATGIGGLSSREMIEIVRTVAADPRLVGADLMELSPPFDQDSRTARLAARLFLEIAAARS